MRSADFILNRRRWLDRPETLVTAGVSMLASTSLIVLAPMPRTLYLEIVAGLLLVIRGSVLRARLGRTRQLCLTLRDLALEARRSRFFGCYEVFMIIAAILTSGVISPILRAGGVPDALLRIVLVLLFGIGLLVKPWILRLIARRAKTAPARSVGGAS